MAKKKATENKVQSLGLFDHIKAITQIQKENYFDTLTAADKKTWDTFMIHRFLSMEPNYIDVINEIQPYTVGQQLKPELVYQILISVIPKQFVKLMYVKKSSDGKHNTELVSLMKKHFNLSKKEAIEYLDMLHTLGKQEEIDALLSSYGYDEKRIIKLTKTI